MVENNNINETIGTHWEYIKDSNHVLFYHGFKENDSINNDINDYLAVPYTSLNTPKENKLTFDDFENKSTVNENTGDVTKDNETKKKRAIYFTDCVYNPIKRSYGKVGTFRKVNSNEYVDGDFRDMKILMYNDINDKITLVIKTSKTAIQAIFDESDKSDLKDLYQKGIYVKPNMDSIEMIKKPRYFEIKVIF